MLVIRQAFHSPFVGENEKKTAVALSASKQDKKR